MRIRVWLILIASVLFFVVVKAQDSIDPGWYLAGDDYTNDISGVTDLTSAGEEVNGDGPGILSLGGGSSAIADAITPEIQALARGLQNDPKRIYDYVHDHIQFELYFGSKKGAQLTLLERSGNDFDQCALLVALLRAAGYSPSYQFGTTYMPYERADHRDFQHWVGVTKPNTNWSSTVDFGKGLMATRGFPYFNFGSDTNVFIFHRIWVKLTTSQTYLLDPAFKISEPIPGLTNLTAAMGLDTNQLLSIAGGTTTSISVQNLAEPALRNKLRDYTTNLVAYLQSNYPNASVEEIISGNSIVSSSTDALGSPLAFVIFDFSGTLPTINWSQIPTAVMSTLTITVDGANQTYNMPSLQGKRLSLTFDNTGLGELWLDDSRAMQKQTSPSSGTINVTLAVDHPHGVWDTVNNTLINTSSHDQAMTQPYQCTNAVYDLLYAFEPNQKWLRERQDQLDSYIDQGLTNSTREVISETLNIMGISWLLQSWQAEKIIAIQTGTIPQYHHRLGRMAQELGRGYYVDVYEQLSGLYASSGTNFPLVSKTYDVVSFFGSAFEHGIIEQMQSSNLVASSTVKMLQLANTNGTKVYLANSGNWSSVKGNLSNYDKTWVQTNYIDQGFNLLLPANGAIQVDGAGTWKGYGMAAFQAANPTSHVAKMLISGGYNGGYSGSSSAGVDAHFTLVYNSSQPQYFLTPQVTPAADPVNMADASFRVVNTDLSFGQSEPRGITFSRYYSPTRRHSNLTGMANGWVHNYFFNLDEISAPYPALGDTTPAQVASMLVATRSVVNLYDPAQPDPKKWETTALIAKWGIDQLIRNGVSVSMGEDTIEFVKQPDGTFTPPAGSTMTLLRTNGSYWVQERHDNTYKFNTNGNLTDIVNQYGQDLVLTYNPSNWVATAKDSKNRTLTFNYSGTPQRLSSISDGSRSVSYGYSGQGDLATVTDPESKTTTFTYDTSHQIKSVIDAAGQLVVSNFYDNFGHITTQYTQGDTNKAWQIYWSGWQNVEQNPAGNQRTFFYDDKSRWIGIQDALQGRTLAFYDGQDHVTKTVSPMFETNQFVYDGNHNLLFSVDALNNTNRFFYDSQNNLARIIDARGNTNSFGYNAKFQLTGETNGAGDFINYVYDSVAGTLSSQTDGGGTTSFDYDTYGELNLITYPGTVGTEHFVNNSLWDVTSHTDGRGFATTFEYNLRRDLTNIIAPTNLTVHVAYDSVGNLSKITDARGSATAFSWSATRNMTGTTLPPVAGGIPVWTNFYDRSDWLFSSRNPLLKTTSYTNNQVGLLSVIIDPLSRSTRLGYDADGRITTATNGAQEVNRQIWNKNSDLVSFTDGAGYTVLASYDENENRISLTNQNQKKWQFRFDQANRLTNTITPIGRQTQITYNNRGLIKSIQEPSTQTSTFIYDAKGRLTNRTDNVGATSYSYDPNDNLTNITEGNFTNSWTFDAYNRVSTYRDVYGNLIQYGFDGNGNLTKLIYPGNKTVNYQYDALNRLTNVTDWSNRITTFSYDLAGHLTAIKRPNGTRRTIDYDDAGQTTNIVERDGSGRPITYIRLGWDDAVRVSSEFTAPLPHSSTIPTRTMSYDDDNRLQTVNGTSVSYDADGNLTNGPIGTGVFTNFTYDSRNRLLTVNGAVNSYDPLGSRIGLTEGATSTKFVVDPNAVLSQVLMRIKNGVTNYYIYGAGLLYQITESATTNSTVTYHYDYRGSTVAMTDDGGNVTDRIEYSTYGLILFRAGVTDTPFLFNGRYGVQTDGSGLLYMRERFYNPYICRFLNADPSGFSGGLNFYAFVDGDPVSLIDPFGLGAAEVAAQISWLRTGASLGVGLIPVAGTVQSGVELITGKDYITGQPVSRVAAGIGLVAGLLPGGKTAVKATSKWIAKILGREAPAIVKETVEVSTKEIAQVASKGRTIKLADDLEGGTAGLFNPNTGETLISRQGVREFAAETGNTVKTELYRTAYHEAFHRGFDPIAQRANRIAGRDLYATSQAWHAAEETLAENYGKARAFLRETFGIK